MRPDMEQAKAALAGEGVTLALCRDGDCRTFYTRGVRPLLDLLDAGEDLSAVAAADRVVGQAAAFLYLLLGVRRLHAGVISTPARLTLQEAAVDLTFGQETPAIVNRQGDGPCPMEAAVRGLRDPREAEAAIRRRLAELANSKKNT